MLFYKPAATALLMPAAQPIAQLPEDMDTNDFCHSWQWMANELQAWEIAATSL